MSYYLATPPIINGGVTGKVAYNQPGQWGRDDKGLFYKHSMEGTKDAIKDQAIIQYGLGNKFVVTDLLGGLAKIEWETSFLGTEFITEDIWELEPAESQKDLLSADFPNGTVSDVTPENKVLVRKALDNPTTTFSAVGTQAEKDKAVSLYQLMYAGITSFPMEASVIRHSQVVSNTYNVWTAFNDINQIISGGRLVNVHGCPNVLTSSLPATVAATQKIEVAGDLQYGWRVSRPRVSRVNYSKWQISKSYQYGLWAVKIHGNVLT